MPPRISAQHAASPSSCQCFRTRPKAFHPSARARQMHASPPSCGANITLLRRTMWEWLKGSGKAFRDPMKGSTNYMSAYDKRGNLLRTRQQTSRNPQQEAETAPRDEDVVPVEMEAEMQEREEEEGLSEEERRERSAQRAALRQQKAEWDARGGLPRERLSDMRPYPLNPTFRSEPVLSEELREELYRQVVTRGIDISTVSAAFSVDTRRVAAVVRLKTIEKRWVEEGKKLATPYNKAVLAMLPQTPFKADSPEQQIFPHESINDLPVHPRTRQQLFYPTSESRHFTREDAARAFDDTLLPADQRIAHPELIQLEKEHLAGVSRQDRWALQAERDAETRRVKAAKAEEQRQWEARTQRLVPGRRWDFKFQDISAEETGRDGRARGAPGIRYGMPHEDRKRGLVKIPTKVE